MVYKNEHTSITMKNANCVHCRQDGGVSRFCCWFLLQLLLLLTKFTNWSQAQGGDTGTGTEILEQWSGCVDPLNPRGLVTLDQPTTICLILADGYDWTTRGISYMRFTFQPIVTTQQIVRFHIPQCK